MAVLSVTRVRVRSYRYYPWFMWQTARIVRQVRGAEGSLAVRFLRDRNAAKGDRCNCSNRCAIQGLHREHGGLVVSSPGRKPGFPRKDPQCPSSFRQLRETLISAKGRRKGTAARLKWSPRAPTL